MRSTPILLFLALGLALCASAHVDAGDKKAEKPADKPSEKADSKPQPRTFDEKEVKEAKEAIDALDAKTRAVICGLRYLIHSDLEAEYFEGRWRAECPIKPFEIETDGPLTLAEQVRLWAVLETGLARNPAINMHLARLAKTPAPEVKNELAPAGLYLLLIRAAVGRMNITEAGKLMDNARQAAVLAKKATTACTPESYWASDQLISIEWFANHFWRAIINRCMLDLGQPAEYKQWAKDFGYLDKIYLEQGWTCQKREVIDIKEDLHANLLAMAAFGLAQGAPAGQFGKNDLRTLESAAGRMPEVLLRLSNTYPDPAFNGARLALVQMFGASPKGSPDGAGWRSLLLIRHLDDLALRKETKTTLPLALGLSAPENRVDKLAEVAEAAFSLNVACGGLLRAGEGPLAKLDLAEIGRLIQAFAIVEASTAPEKKPPTPLEFRVNKALDDARAFLIKSQNVDGSFANDQYLGPKGDGTGAQCLAVLALLHAGEPRESEAIKRAIKYLEGKDYSYRFGTYEASLQLMMMEKYFEKEIIEAGMFEATNLNEYNTARDKLVSLMPRNYRELAKNCTNILLSKHELAMEGSKYRCGGAPRPKLPKPVTGPPVGPGGKTMQTSPQPDTKALWDNSNSQFCMLGLKAACMLAINVPSSIFRQELERLLDQAESDHEAPHVPMERPWKMPRGQQAKPSPRQTQVIDTSHCYKFHYRYDWTSYMPAAENEKKKDYSSGSFGCSGGSLASLAYCFDELHLRGEWTRTELEWELERYADNVLWGGLAWLSLRFLKPPEKYKNRWKMDMTTPFSKTTDGVGFFYDAWSLSRAATALGAVTLSGGNDWYHILAERICDRQLNSGGWGPEDPADKFDKPWLCNTAFAILVLRRSSQPILTGERRGQDAPPRLKKPVTGDPAKGPTTGDKKDGK